MEAEFWRKLVILEFKYLQNKKCWKKAAKSTRIRIIDYTDCFNFILIADESLQFTSKKWRFSIFTTTLTLTLTLLIMPASLLFQQRWTSFDQFCPKTTRTLIFFPGFQWNMFGDSSSNFNRNPVVLKNIAKTSRNYHFLT